MKIACLFSFKSTAGKRENPPAFVINDIYGKDFYEPAPLEIVL